MPLSSAEKVKSDIRQRYDRYANVELSLQGAYETVGPAKHYFRLRKLETALELGAFPAGGQLLDIGCNIGQFSLPLARMGYRVTGVDLSVHAITLARQRAQKEGLSSVSFLPTDAESLGRFSDGFFDGVVSFSTLRYVPSLPKALLEIRRVLKPGGCVVADFPNRWCPWFYVKQWLGSEVHPHDHWFTAGLLRKLFEETGFHRCRIRKILFTPTIAPQALLKIFQVVDWAGERVPGMRDLAGILTVAAHKP